MTRLQTMLRRLPALAVLLLVPGQSAAGQGRMPADSVRGDTLVYLLSPVEVTATRTARQVFETPAPVNVITSQLLQDRNAETVAELFKTLPGLDVTGVGVQQPRPVIRGLRGQRVLLLQDGIRLNNSRRQQDFGEVPSLTDISTVERVEVVRGAASVLYGSDAIGGVVNVITRRPRTEGFGGSVAYGFGSASELHRTSARLTNSRDAFDFEVGGSWRQADAYSAPAGDFGDISLESATPVANTGVEDLSLDARFTYRPANGHELFVRGERYQADDAGFGLVDPTSYAPGDPRVEITYPRQRFAKLSLGYRVQADMGIADRIEWTAYGQNNERSLAFDFFQGFGPQAPPGAGITIDTDNFTDLETLGARFEAKKLTGRALWTYGFDFFRDESFNTDRTVSRIEGFGPPQVDESDLSNVPGATYRSLGGFAQAEVDLERATLIGGVRFQSLEANADAAPQLGLDAVTRNESAWVASINAIVDLTSSLSLIGSFGRGFRAPNLIEFFFEGPIPEASAYQQRNPDLSAETSLSLDAGLRYQHPRAALEVFAFRNRLKDGIRTEVTGDTIQRLAAFQPVNVDELIYRGVEASLQVSLGGGVTAVSTYTHLSSEDKLGPAIPTSETFANRVTGSLRYDDPGNRFFAAYDVRHNGEQRDVDLTDNPLGAVLPAFTVHGARVGARTDLGVGREQRITLGVNNLTDALYAEFSNASFFRPEPGRSLTLSIQAVF